MEKTFEFADNVVGFLVNKEIDKKKIDEILSKIKDRLEVVSPICLYLEDGSGQGISIAGFLKAMEFHYSHSKELKKIAIVTDHKLFEKSMDIKDLVVPAHIKSFEKKERMKAMNWLMI
ncbi:SpoIIAA-like protein [Salegentibacter sp. 24]|uniref:STAS/SEC14 domain-containing protein n=1 Tax=Salegentibacter sp. 24 TaxID=2183986 RepID=UPI001060C44B|nr:STAS/SEC14 domain-containing protein [Salegentibacter sp. 24]TDN81047.1 SpoIIAA-like protein [Salegentibacter sp. 24]